MKPPKYMYIVHVYPYKSIYVGWVYRKTEGDPLYYCDPTIKEIVTFENKIIYMCIGFSEGLCLRKFENTFRK